MPLDKKEGLLEKFAKIANTNLEATYIISLIVVLVLMPVLIITVIPRIKKSERIRDYSSAAESCDSMGVAVTSISSPVLYMDTGITPSPTGMYIGYEVTNNSVRDFENIWVKADTFEGPYISLGTHDDGISDAGTLASGATTYVFFYVTSSEETATPEHHEVFLFESEPSDEADPLCSSIFSLTAEETIKANANKVNSVSYDPPVAEVGGSFSLTITGETGVIGHDRVFAFTPISYEDWPADTFELTSSSITLTGGNTGTYSNILSLEGLDSPDSDYTITYTFNVLSQTETPTPISPQSYISSGQPVKHTRTDTPEYEALTPIQEPVLITEDTDDSDTGETVEEEAVEEEIIEETGDESEDEQEEESAEEEVSPEETAPTTEEETEVEDVADTTAEEEPAQTDEDSTVASTDAGTQETAESPETTEELQDTAEQTAEHEETSAVQESPIETTDTSEDSFLSASDIPETKKFNINEDTQRAALLLTSITAGTASVLAGSLLFMTSPLRPMGIALGGTDMTDEEKHELARRLCAKQYKTQDIIIDKEKK